jgi:hypothetical protein
MASAERGVDVVNVPAPVDEVVNILLPEGDVSAPHPADADSVAKTSETPGTIEAALLTSTLETDMTAAHEGPSSIIVGEPAAPPTKRKRSAARTEEAEEEELVTKERIAHVQKIVLESMMPATLQPQRIRVARGMFVSSRQAVEGDPWNEDFDGVVTEPASGAGSSSCRIAVNGLSEAVPPESLLKLTSSVLMEKFRLSESEEGEFVSVRFLFSFACLPPQMRNWAFECRAEFFS